MEVDYDAVNESINESIMEDIGGMNVVDFLESLSGDDYANAVDILSLIEASVANEDLTRCLFNASVNDTLDYLEEHYQFDDHNVYEEFMHIITREVDRQFEERSR